MGREGKGVRAEEIRGEEEEEIHDMMWYDTTQHDMTPQRQIRER